MAYNAQAAAYLAYYAYIDSAIDAPVQSDFASMLSKVPSAANGPWTLLWGPAANDGIVLYVARGRDGTLCLAFRGTNTNYDVDGFFNDVLNDALMYLVPWLYPRAATMNGVSSITAGMNFALAKAIAVTDPTTNMSLMDFLQTPTATAGSDLMVTGHSLGGALAVLATGWLYNQLPKRGTKTFNLLTATFAAPTVSTSLFSNSFAATFPYYAYVNSNDIVPMAWNNISGILNLYPSPGPSLYNNDYLLYLAIAAFVGVQTYYTAISPSNPMPFTAPLIPTTSFTTEASQMHSMQFTYFKQVVGQAGPPLPRAVATLTPTEQRGKLVLV